MTRQDDQQLILSVPLLLTGPKVRGKGGGEGGQGFNISASSFLIQFLFLVIIVYLILFCFCILRFRCLILLRFFLFSMLLPLFPFRSLLLSFLVFPLYL